MHHNPTTTPQPEEDAVARQARLRREAAALAQAEAELQRGEAVPLEVLEAWLDALDHDPAAPLPGVTRR